MRQPVSRLGRTAVLVPGVVAALTLAGCKDDQGGTATPPSASVSSPAAGSAPASQPATPPPPSAGERPGGTKLTVTVRMSPSAKPIVRTLTCDPAGGTVPNAAGACAALAKTAAAKGGDPFAPTPKNQMCTQIFGGPQTATVKGTWHGRPVDATFDRKNGCAVKRWNDIAAVFGPLPHTPVR